MKLLGKKTKSNNNYDDENEKEFERQMKLAIKESIKYSILSSEEKQIELAIKESLKETKLNSRPFFGINKNIILDDEDIFEKYYNKRNENEKDKDLKEALNFFKEKEKIEYGLESLKVKKVKNCTNLEKIVILTKIKIKIN